jgi:hypothetical protein
MLASISGDEVGLMAAYGLGTLIYKDTCRQS